MGHETSAPGDDTDQAPVDSDGESAPTGGEARDTDRKPISYERAYTHTASALTILAFVFIPIWLFSRASSKLLAIPAIFLLIRVITQAVNAFRVERTPRRYLLDLLWAVAFGACAAAFIVRSLQPVAEPSSRKPPTVSNFKILFPRVGGADLPISINCPQSFSGSAKVPKGYTVIFGSRFEDSSTWVFHEATMNGDEWTANQVYMVQNSTNGRHVYLIAMVIKTSFANYYLHSYQQAISISHGKTGTWWDSRGVPPEAIAQTSQRPAKMPDETKLHQTGCWESSVPAVHSH